MEIKNAVMISQLQSRIGLKVKIILDPQDNVSTIFKVSWQQDDEYPQTVILKSEDELSRLLKSLGGNHGQ